MSLPSSIVILIIMGGELKNFRCYAKEYISLFYFLLVIIIIKLASGNQASNFKKAGAIHSYSCLANLVRIIVEGATFFHIATIAVFKKGFKSKLTLTLCIVYT